MFCRSTSICNQVTREFILTVLYSEVKIFQLSKSFAFTCNNALLAVILSLGCIGNTITTYNVIAYTYLKS